jgi:hypothetical protein
LLTTIHKLEAQNKKDNGNANHESAGILHLPSDDQYMSTDGSSNNTNAGFQGRAQLKREQKLLLHLVRTCMQS